MDHEVKYTGLGFVDALTLLFIGLKLCKVINWPWFWVLSPLWISIGLFALVALVLVVLAATR